MEPVKRKARRQMSEINVVPYIDVMLVLLVIFMITAPLMTLGIKVELPKVESKPMETQQNLEPLILYVDKTGKLFLSTSEKNLGNKKLPAISQKNLFHQVKALLKAEQNRPVFVKGDTNVKYGYVMEAMAILQQAGATGVGLINDPVDVKKLR